MRKMKKAMALALTAFIAAGTLAACGSTGSTESKTASSSGSSTEATASSTTAASSSAAGEKIVIKVTRWGDGAVEQQLIDEFNKTNDKNIEVKLDVIPGDGYGDRLTTSFSSGDGYDIFLSGEGDFYKWVQLGMVAPLDDYIKNDTAWSNPMSESVMKMGVVENSQSYLIKDYNPMALWYNKDMFDNAGVAYPSESWTWKDLEEAAGKLTKKADDGTFESFGFQAQSWAYAVGCYLESKGLSYISDDYTEVEGYLNAPEMAEALDTYFGWTEGDNRISPNAADTDSYGDGTAMMINGKLAMFVTGGWAKKPLEDAGVNYGVALLPEKHTAYYCAAGYAISRSCKNPEAAWEVLKLITGEKASELRVELEAVFPTAEAQLEAVKAKTPDEHKALFETLEYSVSPIGMRGKVGSAVNSILDKTFERIIFKDGSTSDILNDAVKQVKEAN